MSAAVVHCRQAPYDLYIGRGRDPISGAPGEWGNPHSHRPSRDRGRLAAGGDLPLPDLAVGTNPLRSALA